MLDCMHNVHQTGNWALKGVGIIQPRPKTRKPSKMKQQTNRTGGWVAGDIHKEFGTKSPKDVTITESSTNLCTIFHMDTSYPPPSNLHVLLLPPTL